MTCQAARPETADTCRAPAGYRVTFADETVATVCEECAIRLQGIAMDLKTAIKVERVKS